MGMVEHGAIVRMALQLLLLCLVFAPVDVAAAQSTRYELGVRVKRLERLLEARIADTDVRASVRPFLEASVRNFFSLRFAAAGEQLDRATASMLPASPETAAALQCVMSPEKRLLGKEDRQLSVTLTPFYGEFDDANRSVEISLRSPRGQSLQTVNGVLSDAAHAFSFDGLPEGDYQLMARLGEAPDSIRLTQTTSVVHSLDERLERLRARVGEIDSSGRSSLARSLRHREGMFKSLAGGGALETDLPVHALLMELEDWAGQGRVRLDESSDRVVLATGTRSLVCRVCVPPPAAQGIPRPVVIALHGAGGSENLFYEGYGAGKIVRLCRDRGWLLVCPRVSPFGLAMTTEQILQSLRASGLAVNTGAVCVVGHSMGASAAMRLAQQPTSLCAVALLGGGGSSEFAPENRTTRWFVSAGEYDFGRRPARRLGDELKRAGAVVDARVYSDTEHLGIVQVALRDVFEMFDDAVPSD